MFIEWVIQRPFNGQYLVYSGTHEDGWTVVTKPPKPVAMNILRSCSHWSALSVSAESRKQGPPAGLINDNQGPVSVVFCNTKYDEHPTSTSGKPCSLVTHPACQLASQEYHKQNIVNKYPCSSPSASPVSSRKRPFAGRSSWLPNYMHIDESSHGWRKAGTSRSTRRGHVRNSHPEDVDLIRCAR